MISFVIPAYNEELLLGRALDAVNDAARRWDSRSRSLSRTTPPRTAPPWLRGSTVPGWFGEPPADRRDA